MLPREIQINEHISLKIRKEDEAETLFDLVEKNREQLRDMLPWVDATQSSEDLRKFIMDCERGYAESKKFDYGIYFDGEMIGSGGINNFRSEYRKCDFGYWIDKDFEGKGITTTVIAHLINEAKEKLNVHRIEIRMEPRNIASRRIPEKLGFSYEGTMRDCAIQNGKFIDLEMWALLV
ncbi:MAG: GNAT family N-acetyltransferase [Candidatus Pacebacteria bacterium]|nr:GNAT family N-acetyltransferase [Candidatus Paceibacterota bacterium]MBP9781018.1 GNAT family N-acetyltransferase [Candidatus Paceibacterota bacterium]